MCQQLWRWSEAGCFEALVNDMRSIIRAGQGRQGQPARQPRAVMLGGRTLQSSCESGPHASYDSDKRRHGAKVHLAVDMLGHGMDPSVTLDDEQERAQVK